MSGTVKVLIVLVLTAFLSCVVSGQDLGSSNALFGGKAAKSGSTTKKATPKRKAASTASKSPSKSSRVSNKAAKPVKRPATSVRKSNDGNVAVKKDKIETTPVTPTTENIKPPTIVSKPTVINKPNAASDELFEKLIVEGNAARDERSYSSAEASYRRANGVKPTDSRAVYGLGNLYSDQQRWEEAENAYRAALKIEPSNAIINVALSYVLSQPVMVPNLSERYAEAEKLARKAIELAPSNALAFDQLGVAMELAGNISVETENAYRNAIRLDQGFAPAYAHLGRLLRRRGMSKESAKAYESAIQRATDVPTMIVIADVMQSELRFAESETLLRRAVENDPKNPTGLLLLGKALTTLGNFDDAEMLLRRSLVVSSNGFMPNSLLGLLYTRQGKHDMAEGALMQALRFVSPNEKRNLALRFEAVGDGFMKAGKAKDAERNYRQAIVLDPEKQSLAGKLAKSQRS
ncbi:MAG: tetratricopeptide repeat protein [Chloracidobacterium sp.]|nr:tetratricopeptide repeat protein [Chloracidobacterium sp.]